jgi:hypothetical protein
VAASEISSQNRLRQAVLALGAFSTIATAIELALERHWQSGTQLIPWASLAVVLIALAMVARARSVSTVKIARWLAIAVMLTAFFGVWQHIEANFDSGELDQRYSAVWETLPATTRWWLAISKSVGPSPPLAPAATAYAAVCVLIATIGRSTPRA